MLWLEKKFTINLKPSLTKILDINPFLKLLKYFDIRIQNLIEELEQDIKVEDLVFYKFAPITLIDVERCFSC